MSNSIEELANRMVDNLTLEVLIATLIGSGALDTEAFTKLLSVMAPKFLDIADQQPEGWAQEALQLAEQKLLSLVARVQSLKASCGEPSPQAPPDLGQ